MRKSNQNLTEFIRYTLLSILGTLGVSCYILADTFFISKGMGTKGLASLNLAIPVYDFIYGTGLMLGMGGATRFSVCKSQNKAEEGNRIYTNTIYLAFFFSLVFALAGLVGSRQIAVLLGADTEILQMTDTYLHWLMIFSPAFIFNNMLLCFVRNDGSPQLCMLAMLVGSFANIGFDYLFIFIFNLGILGAVLATATSPVISMLLMLPHWTKKKNTFYLVKTGLEPSIVKWDFSLGFPSLLAQVSAGVVMIIFNFIILNGEGNTGIAAYGVVANMSLVIVAIYNGIAQGIQPLLSSYYGKNDRRQIRQVMRYAMTTMVLLSFSLYLLIFVFAGPITDVFNSENNTGLQRLATAGLRIYFFSNVFVGYNTILATFFTSVEKVLPAHVLSILRGFVLIIPMAFLLSVIWGITGVWLSYPVTELIAAAAGAVLYYRYQKAGFC
jgi:putative MATE family efflux protein